MVYAVKVIRFESVVHNAVDAEEWKKKLYTYKKKAVWSRIKDNQIKMFDCCL